jgi:hypothetical protein
MRSSRITGYSDNRAGYKTPSHGVKLTHYPKLSTRQIPNLALLY